MGEFPSAPAAWIAGGAGLAAFAALVFRANLARYGRITGYCFRIAALRTLLIVGVLLASAGLAWSLPGQAFAPGLGRNVARLLLFGLLEGTLGRAAVAFGTLVVEKTHYL